MKKKEDNGYKKISVIHKGQGGSSVFLAIDSKKNVLTAIKSIPKSSIEKDSDKQFRRELQNLHNLKHPNIIRILDFLNNKTTNYIVLEYCNGGNLHEYMKKYMIKNKAPLNEFFIQKILKQIAPALEFMHSKNVIHRDIKLENILLNFNNYPNIPKNGKAPQPLKFSEKSLNKDFSVKITGLNFSKDLIHDNMGSTILGSPCYMSPDMVQKYEGKSGNKYNTSMDLWSLGVITYELLTGTTPFIGQDVNELFKSIESGVYKLPNKLKPSVEIISLINGLLQYYPEKRLNWDQIREHPFFTKNVEDFNFIDLELYNQGEKKDFEIDSKNFNSDNLLWIYFKCKSLEGVKVDKINQKEIEKANLKKKLEQKKVINEEVKKATEQEKIEKEKEKEEINKMKKNAEEEKKKAELEKIKRQEEQEKLIKEENDLNNKKAQLLQTDEKNKKGSEQNQKKTDELKELEKKLEEIKLEKENAGKKLQNINQKIAEAEKTKKFTEQKIKKMTQNDNSEQLISEKHENEIKKLNEEKNNKCNEIEQLKKEEEIKQQKYLKEKEDLEKKKNTISEEKKKLENEMNKNNEVINKINDSNKQLQNLEDELKQRELEKEQKIKEIKEATEELKKQINEYNKIIKEKEKEKEESKEKAKEKAKEIEKKEKEKEDEVDEKEEKEMEKKDIFSSFVTFNKEDYEKVITDEWETISEKDVNFEDEQEIDIDAIDEDFEIIENYVDSELAKNEAK